MALLTTGRSLCTHCMIRDVKYTMAGRRRTKSKRKVWTQPEPNLVISPDWPKKINGLTEMKMMLMLMLVLAAVQSSRGISGQLQFLFTNCHPAGLVVNITPTRLKFNLIFDPQTHFWPWVGNNCRQQTNKLTLWVGEQASEAINADELTLFATFTCCTLAQPFEE